LLDLADLEGSGRDGEVPTIKSPRAGVTFGGGDDRPDDVYSIWQFYESDNEIDKTLDLYKML